MSHTHPQTYPILRSRKSAFPIIAALLFACSLFTLFVFVPSAFADELAPEAPGIIAGVVRNAQGEPQAGINVTLYKLNSNLPNLWTGSRATVTSADGTYRFPLLLVGIYRVGVIDPTKVYAESYYPAAPKLDQATDITILGNQLTNIDLTLQPGSQIRGVITWAEALTVTNTSVELFQQLEEPANNRWQSVQSIYITSLANSSVYSFTGLSATSYRICARGYTRSFMIYECYDNVYEVSRATNLTLTVGATLSDVNILLGDGADYAQISGRVTTVHNEPLADIDVYASPVAAGWPSLSAASMLPLPPTTPLSTHMRGGGPVLPYYGYDGYSARTDSQGNYHLPMLTAGGYILSFNDPDSHYAFTYYRDAQLAEAATVLNVAQKQIISDVNAELEASSYIVGNVTILGQPASNAYITAELETPFGWRAIRSVQTDSNNGRYQLAGLPAGTYRVTAYGSIYDEYMSYAYQGYFGGNTQETATKITLTVGATKTADIALSGTEQFEGSISGQITAGGAPVAGIKVVLYRGGDLYCCSPSFLRPVVYVFTDADGRYTISGLTTTPFHVGAIDPAGIYATTYYTGYGVPAFANLLIVEDGKATTGINIDLPLGGAISGRVTQRDGAPVSGLFVSIYVPAQNDPFSGNAVPISNNMQTDATGRYRVSGLHAGDYLVCFTQQPNAYGECYGTLYFNYYDTPNGRVNVVAGTTTTDIDLIWGPDLTYYLPLIGQ